MYVCEYVTIATRSETSGRAAPVVSTRVPHGYYLIICSFDIHSYLSPFTMYLLLLNCSSKYMSVGTR